MNSSATLIDSVADTTAQRDRDDLYGTVAQLFIQYLGAESVCIFRLGEEGGVAVLESIHATDRGPQATLVGGSAQAVRVSLDDHPEYRPCLDHKRPVHWQMPTGGWRNLFPIEGEKTVNGVVQLDTNNELATRDVSLVGGILRIVRNHLALLDYGECDTLTGLLNRKTFESRFEKLRQRLRPKATAGEAEPGWLAVVDIDKFKLINDTYGHLFGDEVLLLVSQIMLQSFRGADLLFRFGGEEFLIVLDHASEPGAAIALDRLRETIATYRFPQVGRVTISLGYTRIDAGDAPATCVERADAALYYAKHHGRNNVRCYETLVASGELELKQDRDSVELF